jgi:hypothetical protein
MQIDGASVFSETLAKRRGVLGERITGWIADNSDKEIVDKIVTQSSDSEFHCLTVVLFWVNSGSGRNRHKRSSTT